MQIFSVSEFIQFLNESLLAIIPYQNLAVEGEVADFRMSQNKWVWFDLKDETGLINCFMTVWDLKVALEDGMKIRVFGYPKIHQKSGKLSLTVKQIELVGQGSLKRAFELLKKKLADEGLFAAERKRPVSRFPQRIALITSPEAAAYTDFIRILNNRWGGVEVDLLPVSVQGLSAIEEIGEAFHWTNEHATDYDVLVLTRGGGSLEDLQAFNSEPIARAVYASKVPVVCGVGHERDETLCDYVADVRAATPSNAAELVAPDRQEVLAELAFIAERLEDNLTFKIQEQQHQIDNSFHLIEDFLQKPREQYRQLVNVLERGFSRFVFQLRQYQESLISYERLFSNLNPRRLLERGFSIVRGKRGIVRRADQVDLQEEIMIELSQGRLGASVIRKEI